MKIIRIETLRVPQWRNILWVQVHTDDGIVGLGETFRAGDATESYIHSALAPYLIGKDPKRIHEHHSAAFNLIGDRFFGFPTRSVELRAISALDIALWDILGQFLNVPMYQLLGGACHERLRTYNTCANSTYNQNASIYGGHLHAPGKTSATTEISSQDDYDRTMADAGELALDLLEAGIDAMKIWPFDHYAVQTNGTEITLAQLKEGVGVVEKVRRAVGPKMEILIEYHGRWQLPAALRIAQALKEFDIYWHEDPVLMDQFDDILRFKELTGARVAGSESHGSGAWYREAFERGAIDFANFDLGWIGGITEGKRIGGMAHLYGRPIAPHDCVGPIMLAASVHMMTAAPNALRQEVVRSYLNSHYRDFVTELPRLSDGWVYPLNSPGLGTKLHPAILAKDDLLKRVSE